MRLAAVSLKNLARRRLRTSLTIAGLAIAVAAIVSLLGMAGGFEQSFVELYHERGADLVVQRKGGTLQLNSGIDESWGPKIAALPNVKQVIAGLMDVIALPEHSLFAVMVNGWEPGSPVLRHVHPLTGRVLRDGDEGNVMLGKVLAANTGKGVGDTITLYGEPFTVVSVFESSSVYENGAAFFLRTELQRLMDRPHQVTGFLVLSNTAGDSRQIERLREQIQELSPQLIAQPTAEFVHNISQIRLMRAAAGITSSVAIFIGVVSVLNTMVMSVFERAAEIGALRAIGWRKSRVIRMILGEAILLALCGALAGSLLGTGILKALSRWPQTAGLITGAVQPRILCEALLVAVGVGTLGALYPAWWAARLWPVEALRRK